MPTTEGSSTAIKPKEFAALSTREAQKTLDGLNTADLVSLFNGLTGSNVKKFPDRATAIKRIIKARKEMASAAPAPAAPKSKILGTHKADGRTIVASAPTTVKEFHDTAADSVQKVVQAEREKYTPPSVTKPTRKQNDERTIIHLKTNLNPKKKGTKAFDRFELYRDGMTVLEALKDGLTREDIRWDTVHGHIAVEELTT